MKNNLTSRITKTAIIAAIYCILTLVLAPISFGPVQFRISEILVLLAIFDPIYIVGLTLGCFLANVYGVYGIIDIVVGSIATLLSATLVYFTYNKLKLKKYSLEIASIWPSIINGIIIGWMLNFVAGLPLIPTMLSVAIGEFVVVSILGVPVFKYLMKRNYIFNIN